MLYLLLLFRSPIDQVKPGTTTYVTAGSVPSPVSYVWRFNNTVIPGANTRSVLADVNGIGKYNVTVTDINGCSNTSADVEVKALMLINCLFILIQIMDNLQ